MPANLQDGLVPIVLLMVFGPIAAGTVLALAKGCCEWIGLNMKRDHLQSFEEADPEMQSTGEEESHPACCSK